MRTHLTAFALALTIGIGIGCSEKISEKISYYFHSDCARWDKETLARPLFTLNEAKLLLGKSVYDRNEPAYPNNQGRIRRVEMVGQDKFFVMVDWTVAPDDGQESLRLYDKTGLSNLSVEK